MPENSLVPSKSSAAAKPHLIEGNLLAKGFRFAIVSARFNEYLVDKLVEGAIDGIRRHGGKVDTQIKVPGSFELGVAAQKFAASGKFDAVICLGVIIRGATSHYDHVATEAARGVSNAQMSTGVPCIFGVVTAENLEQAIERCGTKMGNKGYDAAVTAIEMANLFEQQP
ncbi:MAG: 6,7-dimethyl-8-ribityllumazine synthase [Planctomycetes bacterium]|nr:6,7-dimethyl-8-ribityllumazine synthase [Planctomycetota bacterium]